MTMELEPQDILLIINALRGESQRLGRLQALRKMRGPDNAEARRELRAIAHRCAVLAHDLGRQYAGSR